MLGVVVALTVPLAGTTLGSALAFFMKKQISTLFQKALLGFAAGVMIAASVWSCLLYTSVSCGLGVHHLARADRTQRKTCGRPFIRQRHGGTRTLQGTA